MSQEMERARLVYKDIIRDAIYQSIVDGELKPGMRVKELEWAEKFGSSQAPVREAIRDLESRGIVVSYPFKGAFVRELSVQELEDIHQVRAGLEAVAMKNAILKASDEDIEGLKQILDNMKSYACQGDTHSFRNADVCFHKRIVELANTAELMKFWDRCNVELWTAFSIDFSKTELVNFADSHIVIYEVLKNREIEKVYQTMDQHFTEVLKDVQLEVQMKNVVDQ